MTSSEITTFIEFAPQYKDWNYRSDIQQNLKDLITITFKQVFDICWKHCDNDTLFLIMEDIDKIKEENNLPI